MLYLKLHAKSIKLSQYNTHVAVSHSYASYWYTCLSYLALKIHGINSSYRLINNSASVQKTNTILIINIPSRFKLVNRITYSRNNPDNKFERIYVVCCPFQLMTFFYSITNGYENKKFNSIKLMKKFYIINWKIIYNCTTLVNWKRDYI